MRITSDELRTEFKRIWTDLEFIVLSDTAYLNAPSMAGLEQFLADSAIDRLPYLPGIHECEEYCLQLVVECRRKRASQAIAKSIPKGRWLNWPLGFVFGTKVRGRKLDHWLNICWTLEGLVLIEPQTDEIWTPSGTDDHIHFLWM